MGIDLTKLRKKSQDGNNDIVKEVLDEVFREEPEKQPPVTDTIVLGREKKPEAGKPDHPETKESIPDILMPDGSHYTGDMYYQGRKVKVGDRVDKDGYTYVTDENDRIYQVQAKDLKPDQYKAGGQVETEQLKISNPAEEQTGFWHTYLGDLVERLGAGAADFGGSLYGLLDVIDKYALQPLTPGREMFNKYLKKKFEKEHPGQEYKSWLERQEENAHNYAQILRERSNRYAGKDYEQLWDESRYGDMIGEIFLTATESMPQSAIAMAGGPAGLTLTGASAARQKYYQLDKAPETKNMPEAMKVFNSTATGIFEYFSEKLGDVKIGQHLKRLYNKVGKEAGEKFVEDEVSAWMTKKFKKFGVLWAPVAEGIEEVSSQVAENITDYCTGATNEWNPFEGGFHSFIYGAAGGAQFLGAGGVIMAKNRYDRFNARRKYRRAQEEVKSAFPDDEGVDTFLHGLTYMSPAEQEIVLANLANDQKVTGDQMEKIVDFAGKANHYKSYLTPEARKRERDASRELYVQDQMRQFDEKTKDICNESGKIQQVTIDGKEEAGPVYIIKGEIAVKEQEDGLHPDIVKSSPELYYRDAEGKMQVISPANITLQMYGDITEIREEYERALRESLKPENEERRTETEPQEKEGDQPEKEEEGAVTIENGENIIYIDEEGKQAEGIVADAFSSPEYVFLKDGTTVVRENIQGIGEESKNPTDELPEKEQPVNTPEAEVEPMNPEEQPDRITGSEISPNPENGYEIEDGIYATEEADGSFRLNVEYSKSEMEKGQKLIDRLNKDYEDYGQVFEMVPLPKKNSSNPLEKPKWGIIIHDKYRNTDERPQKAAKVQQRGTVTSRFANRNRILGDYISVRDEVLRGIATGRFRFVWNDKDIRRGLSKELGFVNDEKERRRRFWMSGNNGYSVDGLAHYLSESPDSPAYGKETEDIRNEIIDIINMYDTPTAMIEAAEAMRVSGEEARQQFFDNLTDEERDWYSQTLELEREFERRAENEIPPDLIDELLAQNITEKELEELQNKEEIINFEQVRDTDNDTGEASKPGTDPAEIDRIKSEGSNAARVEKTIGNRQDAGGSEKNPVSVEVSRHNAGSEQRIKDKVNSEINRQIKELRRQLESKQKELKQKKEQIGRAFTEDKQLSLFVEETKPAEELFHVERDFSEKNLGDVFTSLQQEIKNIEAIIRQLEQKRSKTVGDAIEAERKQGKLFEDEEITREDIERSEADEQQKDMALDYLEGEENIANKLAYLSIKNKIEHDRNRSEYIERSSQGQTGTHTDTEVIQSLLSAKRESGRSNLPGNDENRGTGGRELPDGGTGQADSRTDDNSTRNSSRADELSGGDGSESPGSVSGDTSGPNDKRLDSLQSGGSRRRPGNGEERSVASGRKEGDSQGNGESSERTDHTESNRKADLDAELDAALADFDKALSKFKKAGKSNLSLSLTGLTNEQIETIGEIVAAGAKVGYVLLKKGIYTLREWADALKKYIGGKLKEAGLQDSDIDELVNAMWDTKVKDESGNRKKVSEFAKEHENKSHPIEATTPSPATFQEKIKIALEKQRAAETLPVVLNDAENIRATLPMLLPEQQDDVAKAERRLFRKESKKGILFTNGTGTGKTYTGLGIIKRFVRQGRNDILIVVPSSEKVKDWSNDGRNLLLHITPLEDTKDGGSGIVVTTYANFRANLELKKRVFDLIVYDECHRIMESQGGDYSITTNTHFQISNKNEFYAVQRMLEYDEDYLREQELGNIIRELSDEIKKNEHRNKKESDITSKISIIPLKKKVEFLEKEQDECRKRWKAKEPKMNEQAKKDVERTKVVFLSATPFKTVFNLRYADGYLFDFPKSEFVGYNVPTGENLFYIENFGAQFRMRYGHLETKGKDMNPEAVSMQEIEFQQRLTREGAMSGRAIESNMDYSRDFIKPHIEIFDNNLFNKALNAIYNFEKEDYNGLREAAGKIFFNYNYTTRLMEVLKTSLFIPRIEKHIQLGRKVVLFHRRKQANVGPPFAFVLQLSESKARAMLENKNITPEQKDAANLILQQCTKFSNEFAKLLAYERTLNYDSAIDQILNYFGKERVRLFNGDISKADKSKAVKDFNDDHSGVDVIIIQEESGKEGISLHDRTGKYPRVLMSLSAPISSITALQIEGRIFRIGQESNAIFEYPTLGLNNEMILFSQNINRKLSTTENLALGDSARDLIRSFIEGIENWSDEAPNEEQGIGGKEADRRAASIKTPYERAVLTYFTNQKKKGKRDQREGSDYYPTPEPLGQKLVEWSGIRTGEWLLEPSAGHGAIAMWVPANCGVTVIEPSFELYSRLGGRITNGNSKILNTIFENHDLVNKYDVICMNPPFGAGGALAMAHIEKAFKHLRNGGRLVAIVPRGSMDKKVDKFLYGEDNKGHLLNPEAQLVGEVILPGCTFQQAGTTVYCRVIVIDKIGEGVEGQQGFRQIDLSYCKDINKFFEELENITMVPRPTVTIKEETTEEVISDNIDLASEVKKTKHTKTDEDLFVVKLSRKVEYNEYKGIAEVAKTNNGNYSKFTGGFNFKTLEDAEKFREQINSEQEEVRHRERKKLTGSVFFSNAEYSVKNIQQTRATPQQWLAMIQKNGGLKVGEDEWLGLSDWLKTEDKKSITKQEILDFIARNEIQVEEVELQEEITPYKTWDVSHEKPDFNTYPLMREKIAYLLAQKYAFVPSDSEIKKLSEDILNGKACKAIFKAALEELQFLNQGNFKILYSPEFDLYETEKGLFTSIKSAARSLKESFIDEIRLEYTTEGLQNKREVVLSVPHIEKWNSDDNIHFGEVGDGRTVAWVRFGETKDKEGKRVLVIDEIQSNRHQIGRTSGYLEDFALQYAERPEAPYINRHIETLRLYKNQEISAKEANERDKELKEDIKQAGIDISKTMELAATYRKEYEKHNYPPKAPFAKNWQELVLKRMLRYAAEQGYDKIAWTKGEQQVERYDLAKIFDELSWEKKGKRYNIYGAINDVMNGEFGERELIKRDVKVSELAGLLGQDLAEKIMSSENNYGSFKGLELRIGGKGMIGFYDKILVDFVNKYGKKWGVSVDEVVLPDLDEEGLKMWSVDITSGMKESVMSGQALFRGQKGERTLNKERIISEIKRLEKGFGVKINVVENRSGLPEGLRKGMKQSSRYPGLYAVNTGEVYIILNEVTNEADVQRTVLHEVVGHKGLRGLLGDRFNDFCEEVLRSMKEEERAAWVKEYKGNRQLAAEEYVASFAEEYREVSAWEKVKAIFKEILRKIGIRLKLSDLDLKYLLWKGAKRLEDNDAALDIIDRTTKDAAMFREVEEEKENIDTAEKINIDNAEKLKFHDEIASRKFRFVEAYQDRMLSVKKLQELIEGKIGKKLPSYMNTYLFENTLASRDTYEIEHFRNNELRRMTNAIAALEKGGLSRREIENYIIAKHGLERNEYIRRKKTEQWYQPQIEELERRRGKTLSEEKYQYELMMLNQEKKAKEARLAKMDFSGLRAVEKELPDIKIEEFIDKAEAAFPSEIKELWEGIKACTDLSLRKWFDAGMMNRKRYDKVRGMFKNYIPLRGFDETIASDVYEYFEEEDHRFNSPLKRAKGRTSRADNPFAYIVSLVESSIVGGNKNLMKLHLLRTAQKYPSDLMTATRVWYREVGKDREGNPQYEILLPVYDEDAEKYRQNVEEFTKEMKMLENEEKVFRSRSKLQTGYRLLYEEPQEHTVKCCLNGEPYAVLLHGDPRAAQAIEGLNDEERIDNKVIDAIRWMNRQMAANFTTRNPAFVASNLTRDLIFSISTLSVKENSKYRNRFVRNIYPASGAIRRYLQNKADRNNRIDELLEEFLKNGGETGYTALYNIDRFKKMVDNAVKETRRNQATKTGMKILDFFAAGNRWAEDLSRFTVYLTSREMGRPVLESIRDAKEVTVNFNRKGSGSLGAQVCKSLYLFFNAAVQSMANFYQMFRKNPRGTSVMMTGYAVAGMLVPFLLNALGGDEAEEEYLNLPDYVRKNNLCIWLGNNKGFLTLPLPIELRAFFSIGDAAYRYLTGRINGFTASGETVLGMMDVLPLSPTGNSAPFVPDATKPIVQAFYLNEDFTGRPIARLTPYNQYLPEYRRVYRGTSDFFIKSSEVMNYFSGGDYATRGGVDKAGEIVSDLLNMKVDVTNPAAHEHLLEEYLGGMYKTVMQTIKTGIGVMNWSLTGDHSRIEVRSMPVLNRFYNRASEYSTQSELNRQYFKCLDELKETESRLRQYQEAVSNGEMDINTMLDKYSEIVESGKQQRVEIIKLYSREINKIREGLNTSTLTMEEKEELEQEILLLKRQMLEDLKQVIK